MVETYNFQKKQRLYYNFRRTKVLHSGMAVAAGQLCLVCFTIFLTFTSINAQTLWENRQSNYSRGYQRHSPCERSSCYPATGNLLIGRENRLWASSTCGLKGHKERYCIVSHLEERKKCFWCDSSPQTSNNPALNHRVENIVYRMKPGTQKRSWWQSENGIENVTIQLDLEAEFHFTHLIITFKTFRPAAMLIERSYDFGKTWQVYRYFAQNCDVAFPGISKDPQRTLTDVVCDSRYSSVAPSTDGEIIMRVLAPNLQHLYDDLYSQEVQNLLKMTNLRINFTKLHTLGDDLLDDRQEIKEKYYYAIYEMVVRGSCSCYGHASRCLPQEGDDSRADMVHGKCECTHNTKGLNCEACEDFYNDLPWKPAGKETNACKRCNCNNHATSCHFDAAVYELTGRVSGGVCDNCMHNTMGRNCEQCKQFFYRDPNLDFSDPEVCQPCNCDPGGSLDEGICDSYTDEASDLVSGRCHCKANVEGRRCDTCKNGFWNFEENNPEGCQPCTCSTEGTINNEGCNQVTGECTCKRYVVGRDCNQCLPEYWGLSDIQDGCKPCECDVGGAYDNNCDVLTGQCRCRSYLTGRTCSTPDQSYFVGQIDFLTLEAETANCTSNCQVEIREPYRPPQETTWTGPGFMLARPGADLEFVVDNIKTSMEYDIVIRYEPKMAGEWRQVEVTIERPSPVDPNGPCANTRPEDDHKTVTLPSDARYIVSPTPTCLEAGKTYKIKLMFKPDPPHSTAPSASILVDSIVLLPSLESIPFFIGSPAAQNRKETYMHYRCGSAFFTVVKGPVPDICKSYHYSIGSHVYGGALLCDCDPTGSVSSLCDSLGGRCQCKPNVVGRRCDHCAPGTYGFGPEGCKACDCNSVGALDNFCDVSSGQCKCQAQTYGRACDQCQPGSWNYPKCQRCQCNGHADTCDPRTGACDTCRDFTFGHNCDRCIEGYYGDPSFAGDIPCRPCPCPGTIESGHSYADHCELDPRSQDVICECDEGYAGSRCDVCADNYYGNPQEVGGSCHLCNCSNNIDISWPGNCDPHTGKCLQCLFNTAGDNCERCKPNFYGDATMHLCTECVCHIMGTNKSAEPCNGVTGQCPCLPNVVGLTCDTCELDHWKIASGMGCEPCDCDPNGSNSKQCNQFDGQCDCKPGFGGRQCDQCQANHWGDPNVECKPCSCDPEGSAEMQCDRVNGSCHCHLGIGGYKCDVCARGYLGTAPHCSPCGECFDNWDLILNQLAEQTEKVIQAAGEIKRTGATGAYTQEFDRMEKQLNDIKQLLQNTTKSSVDLGHIDTFVDQLRDKLKTSQNSLNDVGKVLNTTQRILLSNLALADLRNKVNVLKETATGLKANATHLQESNVEGALNLTREAAENSRRTQAKGADTQEEIAKGERQCKRTEALVGQASSQFTQGQQDNTQAAYKLDQDISQLEKTIPDLNEQVCYKRGDPCDQLCGGAGCGFCGGISCEEGAFTKSSKAFSFATDAENKIYEKEAKAEELFRGISQAKAEAAGAKEVATEALTAATLAQNRSEAAAQQSSNLILRLQHFLDTSGATSAEIQDLARKTQEKNIELKPEQITELAHNINTTVASLTDINKILADTAGDLSTAQRLKAQADAAKADAENVESTAQEYLDTLKEAETTQEKIQSAIDKADEHIGQAKIDLTQITSETGEAQQKANETVTEVNQLQERVKSLQTGFLKNQKDAQEVKAEAVAMTEEVKRAEKRAQEMQEEYTRAVNTLRERTQNSGLAQARAQKLLEKASQLSLNTTDKLKQLRDAEGLYREQEKELTTLTDTIKDLNTRMGEYLMDINKKSTFYRQCLN